VWYPIECSLTGTFQLVLHKRQTLNGTPLTGLDYPLLETADAWVVHGFSFANYLADLGDQAQKGIFGKSSLGGAMRDAFRKMRRFLMTVKGLSEDEAISLMSVGVDFGVTQVVDANWGIHAILKKSIFVGQGG
jgi:acetamidase/formamidase